VVKGGQTVGPFGTVAVWRAREPTLFLLVFPARVINITVAK
jgi:hypothetical protein